MHVDQCLGCLPPGRLREDSTGRPDLQALLPSFCRAAQLTDCIGASVQAGVCLHRLFVQWTGFTSFCSVRCARLQMHTPWCSSISSLALVRCSSTLDRGIYLSMSIAELSSTLHKLRWKSHTDPTDLLFPDQSERKRLLNFLCDRYHSVSFSCRRNAAQDVLCFKPANLT
jgi:hypothetical protein